MKKKIIVLIVALIVVLGMSLSLAYLNAEDGGVNNNSITLANFSVDLITDITNVDLGTVYPMSDSEGLSNSEVTFAIQNKGTAIANYKVSLIDKDVVSTLNNTEVRYQLKRKIGSNAEETLPIKNLAGDGELDSGTISSGTIITYKLIMWQDYNSTVNGAIFSKAILVEGMQISNLDTSGANFPELLDNMIPVYYDKTNDTEGVWRKADSTNRNSLCKWFDYNDQMWANAVTVKETNGNLQSDRSVYLDGVDDYVSLGLENFEFQNSMSTVIRFKLNSITSNVQQDLISSVEAQKGYSVYLGKNGKIYGRIGFEGESNYIYTDNGPKLSTNTWYTAVLTYDGTKMNMYINGGQVGTAAKTGNINPSILPITLGGNPEVSGAIIEHSSETVKSVLIYNDALTSEEIKKYFSEEITDYPKDNLLVEKNEFTEQDTRSKNINSSVGTEIPMDDITSMWVWIPRYKYVMFNANNETANEQMIDVVFEHGIDSTGTISCQDDIQNLSNSDHSEICTDKNGSIENHKSTYTHPAFTFGNEKLTGFWMSKFQMSTDDTTCNNTFNDTNCNKQGLNILVKPNEKNLKFINVGNSFANFRKMETYGNIHGFNQSSGATTWLDSNNNLTGDIKNDSNNYDIHMTKNMEWGAVAYLSQSKYGKQGNSIYSGNYKELYINNAILDGTYKTGYSGGSYDVPWSDSNTYAYNNLTIQESGKGYLGAGASTTGTIYGVYDMSGIANEFVMGNQVNSAGNFSSSQSGFSTVNDKYYDKYSYGTNGSSFERGKLGDTTREIKKNSETSTIWYQDNYSFINGANYTWISRGYDTSHKEQSGIFVSTCNNGQSSQWFSSRPVLTISRDMPWLNNN